LAIGELMLMMRHLLFAAEALEAALALTPNDTTILAKLTDVRVKQRMPREVVDLSRRSLALDPQSFAATIALATAQIWLGEVEEAAEAASRALALDPNSLQAAALLQAATRRLGRQEEAATQLAEIERRCRAYWDQCAIAIDVFFQLDEDQTAEHLLRQVIADKPDFVPALQWLGRFMILRGAADEGLALMQRVCELNPEEGDAQTSVSLTLIRNGDFTEGWARHHWRWKRSGCEPKWDLPVPEWDGRKLEEGSLILWREQGIGDMVMYVAPALLCRHLAPRVMIETNLRLRALLQRSFPDMTVVSREELASDFVETHNIVAHSPIGDLPHLLKLNMDNYPGRDGFLIAHPKEVKRLRDRYKLLYPGKRLVGISWRSGNSSSAILRSAELPLWMPIFETKDCAFISLQYGDVSKDVEQLREEHGVEVYVDSEVNAMQDMDRFAAQIAALDMVISVDNSTVHVAGALGKTTLALVPYASDWRWLTLDRTDCVWYRSLSLLRQDQHSDWAPQIAIAAARLRDYSLTQLDDDRRALYLRCAEQAFEYGGYNTAELYFRQILADAPDDHPSLAGLGRIAIKTGHIEDAIGLLRRAVECDPNNVLYNRALVRALTIGGRHEQAFAVIRRLLQIESSDIEGLTLGIEILRHLGNTDEAANYCARLLRVDPENVDARFHLAQLQAGAGDFEVSEGNFERVLEKQPDNAAVQFALGCLALRRGNLTDGWAGFARRHQAGLLPPLSDIGLQSLLPDLNQPEILQHARIAVRPEPGLKDQLLFARWLAPLRQDTAFVAAELDPRLIPLIDQKAARVSLYPTGSLTTEDMRDLELTGEIALGDLGALYGTNEGQLTAGVPYLQFDQARAQQFRAAYLAALQVKQLIGICWRGGEMAIPLSKWLPILETAGFGFIALQAGPVHDEIHGTFNDLGKSAIRDPSIDPQTNLRGFAAQVAAVDLVISVDEVPAYLAGALGVPTITLLPTVADWRWFGQERHDSPWFPTMQLYRQPVHGGWTEIMEAIAGDLDSLARRSEKRSEA
jgi:tetratricopeptide (TPR) repeat protein